MGGVVTYVGQKREPTAGPTDNVGCAMHVGRPTWTSGKLVVTGGPQRVATGPDVRDGEKKEFTSPHGSWVQWSLLGDKKRKWVCSFGMSNISPPLFQ